MTVKNPALSDSLFKPDWIRRRRGFPSGSSFLILSSAGKAFSQRAFYYVRVLEIPTPTWLAYDKAFYGDKVKLPDDALMVHQERAYTSPIWYTLKG